ncbi:TetR/AcrR family transcriptional regulator [Propionibacterium sp.]|uniref:TetR/AcrR family transcriptional regulator n=1 Tax=Propionibacterium sp. TaxID=1977903 RepID=UPI0039E73733
MGSKERLIEATSELLWERGYAATSPHDIMALAGVGQGSMYHHFSGKHDLAVQALRLSIERAMDANGLLDSAAQPLERLRANLFLPRPGVKGCRVGRMTQDPDVLADPELLGLVAEAFEQMHRKWAETIREAIDAGQLPGNVDPDDLASAFQAVIQGGYVLAKASGDQAPMDAAMRGAAALLDVAATSAASQQPAITAESSLDQILRHGVDGGEDMAATPANRSGGNRLGAH